MEAGTSKVEPSIGDLSPIMPAGVEKEPMLLLDTTGSMSWPNTAEGGPERRQVIQEAMLTIVTRLAAEDSQAEAEKAAGEDAGGLMTVTFADGQAECIDDLSPENFQAKWAAISWGGGTYIMPGWTELMKTYMEEFGDVPALDRPQILALVITDGEANDTDAFASELSKLKGVGHACIAVMGYGDEHDRALLVYQGVAESNPNVRVVSFGNETDPNVIADAVDSLLG